MSSHLRIGKTHLKAFTLVELMVVVVIIGLLASLATVSYLKAQSVARDNTRKTDISAISAAVETYYATNKTFPGYVDETDTGVPTGSNAAGYTDGCQSMSGINAYHYVYYYNPAADCSDPATHPAKTNAAGKVVYDPASFAPSPSWIPNLSTFINPIPVEKRYKPSQYDIDNNITQTTGDHVLGAKDTGTNQARTYVYIHSKTEAGDTGYQVFGRLENTSSGDNYYTNGAGSPIMCPGAEHNETVGGASVIKPGLVTTGQNLFIICK